MLGITRQMLAIAALALIVFTGCSHGADAESTATTEPATTSSAPTDGETRDAGFTTRGGGQGTTTTSTTTTTPTTTTTEPEPEPFDFVSRTAYLDAGDWAGSGVIIDGTNLILTNAHVVEADGGGVVDWVRVSIASDADLEPVPMYWATVEAHDPVLDLAIVAVVEDLGENAIDVELSGFELGDSDEVEIQDEITIAGFPGIGGTTISATTGMVAGFETEHPIGVRAWIKTDAAIAGGNSGGPAFNEANEVVAIPTQVGEVDCRTIADTNRDGTVDGQDTCVPVGGDLNLLRPVNFAAELIESVRSGTEYVSPYEQPEAPEDEEPEPQVELRVDSIAFADADTPQNVIAAYPAGTEEVCVQAVVLGMTAPTEVAHEWYIDGEPAAGSSSEIDGADRFTLERCLSGGDGPLPNGTYELTLEIGDVFKVVSAGVGTGTSEVTFVNAGADEICLVQVAADTAAYWGPSELSGPLMPGEQAVFMVAGGASEVRVVACDGEELTVAPFDLEPVEELTFT